jgi:transcriptional regulator GlxA family with amidase domain
VRYSTRVEIYRRLHRTKDFIDSNFKEDIGLAEMADIATLSRYHFLRLFKTAFGETPHQYLIRKRLDAAQKLLLSTNLSITQVCFEVGFESLSSINRLFSQYVGQSPRGYRRRELLKENSWLRMEKAFS